MCEVEEQVHRGGWERGRASQSGYGVWGECRYVGTLVKGYDWSPHNNKLTYVVSHV